MQRSDDFVGVNRRQNESGVLRGGKFFRGLFLTEVVGSHGDNQPLSVPVFKMNTTTSCGEIQATPQNQWDLHEKYHGM